MANIPPPPDSRQLVTTAPPTKRRRLGLSISGREERINDKGEKQVVSTVSFMLFVPVSPKGEHLRQVLEAVGESIEDAIFLVLDGDCVPAYINSYGRHFFGMDSKGRVLPQAPSTIPGVPRCHTKPFIDALMPESERERTWKEWKEFSKQLVPGSVHVYDTNFLTPNGVLAGHVTDSPIYEPASGKCFGIHIVKTSTEDVGLDPRVEELAEELQRSVTL